MVKWYWEFFWISLISIIICIIMFVLSLVFRKKFFLNREGGLFILIAFWVIILSLGIFCANLFVSCCQDYSYVANQTYIEEKGKVIKFAHVWRDSDGNGHMVYENPVFYLIDKDETVTLRAFDVEIGETYLIRYYPHIRICEVVEKL